MGNHSSDSDDESYSRKRRKKRRKSRSYSRDRDRHRRYGRSRSRSYDRSKKHKRKHKRRRSTSSDSDKDNRWSKSHSSQRSVDRSRTSSVEKENKNERKRSPPVEELKNIEPELKESEKLSRSKIIEEISSGSFTQQSFHSNRSDKVASKCDAEENDLEFGTNAELKAKISKSSAVSTDSLFSPQLFGDPEEREEKYLKRLYVMRMKAFQGEVCF